MQKIVWALKKYSIIFVLLGLVALFSIMNPLFFTRQNLANLLSQSTYFIITTVGLSYILIAGAIDLSVGYQLSLTGVIVAMLMVNYEVPVFAAVLIGLLLGCCLGLFNGLIVTRLKINPIIATLATTTVFQGASYLISSAKTIRKFPASFAWLSKGNIIGLPPDVWLTLIILAVTSFIYNKTYFGRHIFAMGGNEDAARLAGIRTRGLRLALFGICGFLVAVASLDMISKANATNSTFGVGTEFTCLTAAIVGGISITGGDGTIWGLLTGVFILQVLQNGMQLAGWGTYAQYIVKGIILLAAVAFDEFQKNRTGGPKNPS
ncbi:MAG: ABC transporter permease [Treponema sp.]|jgi:ribose/xylose/arabinose/galactoside ABC-type transport system permease subunit|nr:ABC transporter permease [Treponema sp.]